MSEEERRRAGLRLVKRHLEIISKHTDNYSNGALTATTPEQQLNIAGLVVEIAQTEAREAISELNALGV